eukprot:CAMPEP_0198327954 /NCGR_PEP_ID=MMETSP1450-20131203/15094_1 /TAXON_ID=753684 ORGANISM="Madagascaria erythrocladiodes, Strain CCMP3234" /NCGR_SAMPLE_ID=MMETSP1450 /ASSEMBLY_ACC=CAM_ASM_001115 /LENGTH=240 /DNA_ID=CAMNT_0044032035 /DNA_START=75 /DNA_END=796 /DNA_ORIENTATION=-
MAELQAQRDACPSQDAGGLRELQKSRDFGGIHVGATRQPNSVKRKQKLAAKAPQTERSTTNAQGGSAEHSRGSGLTIAKVNSVIHPDPDHHAEQKDKQQLSCNFEQDDKTANALATAWPGALAHTMVRGVRRWIGKVASKWPLKGKSLLLAVTKVCPRDPWAFVELGTVYVRIGDDRTAIEYFAMAAERGSAVGMLCLGDMLVQGKGGRRDHSLGQQLISKSLAVLGDGTGQSGIAPADV